MFKVFNDMLKNLLINCDKLFLGGVWQSIAEENSSNNFFISKIAWVTHQGRWKDYKDEPAAYKYSHVLGPGLLRPAILNLNIPK
jgi:hypothetical protein